MVKEMKDAVARGSGARRPALVHPGFGSARRGRGRIEFPSVALNGHPKGCINDLRSRTVDAHARSRSIECLRRGSMTPGRASLRRSHRVRMRRARRSSGAKDASR